MADAPSRRTLFALLAGAGALPMLAKASDGVALFSASHPVAPLADLDLEIADLSEASIETLGAWFLRYGAEHQIALRPTVMVITHGL